MDGATDSVHPQERQSKGKDPRPGLGTTGETCASTHFLPLASTN
jgi:hypothetical protein